MHRINIVYWQEGDGWLGYLQEYPDYWTQGETLEDLKEHLRDLYREAVSGELARLERQGLLRRASDPLPREVLMAKVPQAEGASVLEALLDDRRNGR
jgi:predicted RNase H-like HicB family nuclease